MYDTIFGMRNEEADRMVRDFFAKHTLRFYKRGEIILRSDDVNEYTFFIKQGYVFTYTISPKGHRDVLSFVSTPTIFPVRSFFSTIEPEEILPRRTRYIEALTDSYLYRAPQHELAEFLKANPAAQGALYRQIDINHKLAMSRVEALQLRDVRMEMIALFLGLAYVFGRAHGKNVVIEAPVSHQLIADSLSLARETVSRELPKLKNSGYISYSPHRIELYDVEKLKLMVENY